MKEKEENMKAGLPRRPCSETGPTLHTGRGAMVVNIIAQVTKL